MKKNETKDSQIKSVPIGVKLPQREKTRIHLSNFGSTNKIRSSFKHNRYMISDHIHQFAEIVYVMEGEMYVSGISGWELAKAGDIIVVFPYQLHAFFTEEGKKVKLWMLLFSDNFVLDVIRKESAYAATGSMIFKPSKELRAFLESRLFTTDEEIIEINAEKARNLKAILYPILDEFLTKAHHTIEKTDVRSDLITRTINFLQSNFHQDITIADCAKQIGYCNSHVSHSLYNAFGITFLQFRDLFRVSYAKGLITNSDKSMYLIALDCGFNCERSFERVFKKNTGLTPKQYRKQHGS